MSINPMRDKADLIEMVEKRRKVTEALKEVTREKRLVERDVTEEVFKLGMFDCLSVNWTRLGQTLSMPVD